MSDGFADDPHCEQGYGCPRNFFGIIDYCDLQIIEKIKLAKRGGELELRRAFGRFDTQHFGGGVRVVNIAKGSSSFGPAMHLEGALADVFGKLTQEKLLVGLAPREFADRAGFHLGEINAIHPFREGNGRTQREFIRQLAVEAGHPLSWAGFTQEPMVAASIRSHVGLDHAGLDHVGLDHAGLAAIVEAALLSTRKAAE